MIEVDPAKCDFCGVCVAVCPANAIELEEKHWSVNTPPCTTCLLCVKLCPLQALRVNEKTQESS
jgi:ferredoxin